MQSSQIWQQEEANPAHTGEERGGLSQGARHASTPVPVAGRLESGKMLQCTCRGCGGTRQNTAEVRAEAQHGLGNRRRVRSLEVSLQHLTGTS